MYFRIRKYQLSQHIQLKLPVGERVTIQQYTFINNSKNSVKYLRNILAIIVTFNFIYNATETNE